MRRFGDNSTLVPDEGRRARRRDVIDHLDTATASIEVQVRAASPAASAIESGPAALAM
jgi:hypothetical protein